MCCQEEELLIAKVSDLYHKISTLHTLSPSKDVDTLFTQLVLTCIPPSSIDITRLPKKLQDMRSSLIKLCGQAEGLLEKHFSNILTSFGDNPLHHLDIFPYYSNYIKLSHLEYTILNKHCNSQTAPTRVAFVGSGPLPLTSIVLASYHLTGATFHNYDIDSDANTMAVKLVSSDPDLSRRMVFHTVDVLDVTNELGEYEVVFLAALVGMDNEEKARVVEHLARHMAPDALLMLRSAHGARGFLYPVVDPRDLQGFEVLSVFHPTDEIINSVMIARKPGIVSTVNMVDHQGLNGSIILPSKCSDEVVQGFNPLNQMSMIEELSVEDQL